MTAPGSSGNSGGKSGLSLTEKFWSGAYKICHVSSHTPDPKPGAYEEATWKDGALDLLNTEMNRRLDNQRQAAGQLDSKAAAVAGFAAAAIQFSAARMHHPAALYVAEALYGVAFVLAALTFAVRKYPDSPSVHAFKDMHDSTSDAIAGDLLNVKVRHFDKIAVMNAHKACTWRMSFASLMLAILASLTAYTMGS